MVPKKPNYDGLLPKMNAYSGLTRSGLRESLELTLVCSTRKRRYGMTGALFC